ncbi:RDD family protein [Algoriphagus sp. A40]|uniref:RDD family protein n=1 Tax=Algoriphagus sp. A40 TaxID=1945863 RepID=UPI0009879455|nr:RDD family protein [Algoriphagus sp. A40]OOG78073.1 hypothetical protein B0E43_02890 [Algoriphagus sp. A40]
MIEIYKHLATSGERLIAYLIDILLIVVIVTGFFYFFLGFDGVLENYFSQKGDLLARIEFLKQRNWIRNISFIAWILYCIPLEASPTQGTLGKRLMGIRVVDEFGNRMDLNKSARRNVSKTVSIAIFSLGFIWILFDKKKQGWHDKLNKTFVVDKGFTSFNIE